MDQANELRNLLNAKPRENPISRETRTSRVITVTSGKGGVGKTNFAVNLAIYFSLKGYRVVILDADFGLANIEVLFGVAPQYNLADILLGDKTIEQILSPGPNGIKFISGGSGLKGLANITDKQMNYLLDNFMVLEKISDIIIVDTGAGVSNSVVNFVRASNEAIIVTTPEPTSITDAYALIKMTKEDSAGILPDYKVIINKADTNEEGRDIFSKLNAVADRFLGIKLEYLGRAPYDEQLVKSVKRQQPVILSYPNGPFSKAVTEIGDKLLYVKPEKVKTQQGVKSFMKRLINIFGS